MDIKELSIEEFTTFASTHPLNNYHQSINYALLKAQYGYEYEFIGYGNNDELKAAALILYKKIDDVYYGYAPRGFLIDYTDYELLAEFTQKIKDYYYEKNFAFIKINPEVIISKLNNNNEFIYNDNTKVVDNLIHLGYKKLKDNMNFEALQPRVNAIVDLTNFDVDKLNKNTRNKIRKGFRKGLTIEIADTSKLNTFYELIKHKKDTNEYYYSDIYNVFSKTNNADLLLVKIDYKKFLINSQKQYEYELGINNDINATLLKNHSTNIINKKMNSDRALLAYKNDIAEASKYLNDDKEQYIAGALIVKHNNRITIEISGYDKKYSRFAPNYFLYFAILASYRNEFKYADLNGVTGDLSKENEYYGLNRFKRGFKPDIYEYIGEFDLIIDESDYKNLLKGGYLAEEFNK